MTFSSKKYTDTNTYNQSYVSWCMVMKKFESFLHKSHFP